MKKDYIIGIGHILTIGEKTYKIVEGFEDLTIEEIIWNKEVSLSLL